MGVIPTGAVGLHIIKVFDSEGWAYSSDLVAALDACIDADANIVSMSLGGSFKSRLEQRAFNEAFNLGVLSIAAAGNDGNTRHSYPASYDSVVSVAAIDQTKTVASFSQQTNQVELAAPGVNVRSTVPMGAGEVSSITAANLVYGANAMDGSPKGAVSGNLVDCGKGEAVCPAASFGQICLIARGNITFSDKVLNCEAAGGAGAIIYNNEPGALSGTLGGVTTGIPSVGISDVDGASLLGELGNPASLSIAADNYAFFDGTSMATPHVSGVAALVWSQHSQCTNKNIRDALAATAEDLGEAGRDNAYGFGLVQAQAANDYLVTYGCEGSSDGSGDDSSGDGKPDIPCRGKNCSS